MSQLNKNRPGYKKTHIGWIPEDWEETKLIKIAKINPNSLKENASNELSFFYIELGMVKEGIIQKPEGKIFFSDAPSRARRQFIKGDILFSTVRPNLKGFAFVGFDSIEFICSTGFSVIRVLNKYDAKFIYYNLFSHNAEKYFVGCVVGSGYPALNNSDVENWKFPLPSLQEQIKISTIISTWYQAIEKTKNLIIAKIQLKKGLTQQLFTGRIRFPSFGPPIKTKIELPNGWTKYKLGDCFKERLEANSKLTLLSITSDRGVIPRDEVERKDSSNSDKSKYKKIVPGDIGYNTMRMWQGVSAVSTLEGIVSPAYTVCSPKNGMVSMFFGYLFKYSLIIHKFHRYSQGLVDDTLNLKFHNFSQIKVNIPTEDEQKCVVEMLSAIDKEIGLLEKEIRFLIKQKNGMIQKLLTGEVRHPDFKQSNRKKE